MAEHLASSGIILKAEAEPALPSPRIQGRREIKLVYDFSNSMFVWFQMKGKINSYLTRNPQVTRSLVDNWAARSISSGKTGCSDWPAKSESGRCGRGVNCTCISSST